ncbi:MAG: tRNA (adenosine(37)-N6)-dimethylallyltransferase MiaA [Verrucomicrobiota bacterium]|nr:tRNA (adenosine(37)-N6)-dimethylallyltransferase MiaA [Verrucomicrobiota bacterium]
MNPLILAGPTAGGKSDTALVLAQKLGAEILSADSMQVYRGMNIGTAKPSALERRLVFHHGLDLVDVIEPYDVGRWLQYAEDVLKGAQEKNKPVIIVGGTGLYIKSLLYGLHEGIKTNPELRQRLERLSLNELQKELDAFGPHGLNESDWQNPRRLVRGIEICSQTGQALAGLRTQWKQKVRDNTMIVLQREKADLVERINSRVKQMMDAGLVEETRALVALGMQTNPTACQALGYRQVLEYLNGSGTLVQCIDNIKTGTRQFAKRQMTWFKNNPATFLDVGREESPEQIANRILTQNAFQ